MGKYNISKGFFPLSVFKPPVNKLVITLGEAFLSLFVKLQHSDRKITVSSFFVSDCGERVRCLCFEPESIGNNAPCIIYCHGGGFIFKAAPYHYSLIKAYALGAGCKVIMPDYSLAPKKKYPAALEECVAAYKYVYDNADTFGIDKSRIAVAGDSAGGCLAAQLCYVMKDKYGITPCFQMLIYPVTDRLMNSDSNRKFTDTPMWNSALSEKMWKYYLQDEKELLYEFPSEREDLSCLPDAYVELAEFDCLHDEGLQYAVRLKKAGCKAEIYETKGTMHGFDGKLNNEITKTCIKRRTEVLKHALI